MLRSLTSEKLDQWTAGPMFAVSALFLAFLAGILHFETSSYDQAGLKVCYWGIALLYPLFVLELAAHLRAGSRFWKQNLVYCVFPPLRLVARDHQTGRTIWFPRVGWLSGDKKLVERAQRQFSLPMIGIALTVLPLMAVEHFAAKAIENSSAFTFGVHLATAMIWLAFTFEFVVMISLVDEKVHYCKKHWLDILVICLPLIAFMRAARLGRLIRLNQLPRMIRVFRLRGTVMRLWRAVLVLEVLERWQNRDAEKQLARLRDQLAACDAEREELLNQIASIEESASTEPIQQAA